MPNLPRVLFLAATSALLALTGCSPECVDNADCASKGSNFVCDNGTCVTGATGGGSGSTGGGSGSTGGGTAGTGGGTAGTGGGTAGTGGGTAGTGGGTAGTGGGTAGTGGGTAGTGGGTAGTGGGTAGTGGGSAGTGGGSAGTGGGTAGTGGGTAGTGGGTAGTGGGSGSTADAWGVTSTGRLIAFTRSTGAISTAITITGLASSETVHGIDIRPAGTTANELYLLGSTGKLYVVNLTTGVATLKSTLAADTNDSSSPFTALSGTAFGVDFNPVADRLRVVSDNGQNLRINVETGATTTDGNLTVGGVARSGVTAAAYTNDFRTACRTQLYVIDTTTDELLLSSDPNGGTYSRVGALSVNAEAVNAFDIVTASTGENTGFAVLTVSGVTSLYSVNLSTGAATMSSALTGLTSGETVTGVAVLPPSVAPTQNPGDLVGVTITGKLLTFNPASPAQLCTGPVAITGLATGDAIIGLDTRPATGDLVALTQNGSVGKLYTVNVTTGVATAGSTLIADSADTTDTYVGLSGTAFGVDFNPVADRLRVVTSSGKNLRINVMTGATTTDADYPGGTNAVSVAYSNSFGNAVTTTLYAIDATADSLKLVSDPNAGTQTTVGNLGTDFSAVSAFEIAPTANTAYLAAQPTSTPSGSSGLYTVNLSSGAATLVATIGGGEALLGLTTRLAQKAVVYAVTTANRLISFAANTPGTIITDVAITGLASGENIVGIDFRPATGGLVAVTNQSRVYVIDRTTGAAMSGLVMSTTLQGTVFGIDFNPTVDRLRVVSTIPATGVLANDTGINYRVDPNDGGVTVDTGFGGALISADFDLFGVAYANNVAGASTTTIYYVDSRSDSLYTSSSPNAGTRTVVGPLGISVLDQGDIDIAGNADNLALGAFQLMGETSSKLYRIDLTTGTATQVSSAAINAAVPVVGLSIRFE